MIISPGRGYIFVHIPKTGGTSLAMALEARAMKDDILIGDTPKAKRRRGRLDGLTPRGRLWKHSRLADIEGVLGIDEIHAMQVVTVIRNPWDRMASYYHWLRAQSFAHPAVTRAQAFDFAAFVAHPETAKEMQKDAVRRYLTTSDGREAHAMILRQDRLATDAQRLGDRLGVKLLLPHENTSDRDPDYRNHYDDATRRLVAEAFSEDIERFTFSY